MLPNFIVIGASRCGTQWIHDNLALHPEIYLPTERQELHFFSKYYYEGIDYYHHFFDGVKNEKAIGEVTPDYIFSEHAAVRIKKHIPNVKLIVSLRNPTDRLYSMYWILKGKYKENKTLTFEQKLEKNPELIKQGFYVDYLKIYFELFGKDKILVLKYDQIKSDPEGFLRKIYKFLDIDENFVSQYQNIKINRATFRKHVGKSYFLYFMWRVFKRLKFSRIAYELEKINSVSIPEMNSDTRKKLLEIYKPKLEELSEFLNTDFMHWNK
ncbi:MAG: hypothetical protein Kow0068_05430 [Marinilabiliales bacterium]